MSDVDPEVLAPLILACDQYPYHELVAYACGHTIGELRDWLERGAAAGDDTPELRTFTREYCKKDALYAKTVYDTLWANCQVGSKGNFGPIWKWFEARWPCKQPLAITSLLASPKMEELVLDETFRDPEQDIRDAMTRTGWFHRDELDNPSVDLEAILTEKGYQRSAGAQPEPRPLPEG